MNNRPTYYLGVDAGNRTTVVSRRDSDGLNEIINRLYPGSGKTSLEAEASRADKTPIGIESNDQI